MTPELLAKYDRRIPRYTSYPTAPHFGPDVDGRTYRSWLRALPPGCGASLYLHVPFCAALCTYCGCHTRVVHDHAPVADYAALLDRELLLVRRECTEIEMAQVHWGGGTPNMLSGAELARLMEVLDRCFPLMAGAEISMEIDARILTADRVAEFAAAGINRASLGVQDFSDEVQRAVNRIQPFAMTARAVDWLRGAGIGNINFDLMYGLPLQTVAGVVANVDRAVTLSPDRIALFGYAHVPWMKRHQRLLREADLPSPEERLRQCEAASARLVEHGYQRVGLDHFARPEDALARHLSAGRLHRNFQGYTTDEAPALIGIGLSAIGSLPQGYAQNTTEFTQYRTAIMGGRFATARGIALSGEDRLRREVIERLMCDLAADLAAIAQRHGVEVGIFGPEMARIDDLIADGVAWREGWRVGVAEEARPLLRAVCAIFDAYLDGSPARHARAI